MSAQEILRMIEEVDPSDELRLNEIDARFYCFLHQEGYAGHMYREWDYDIPERIEIKFLDSPNTGYCFVFYTTSRDALKAIRPDGWYFDLTWVGAMGGPWPKACLSREDELEFFTSPKGVKTEELAELHAIIQAIEHERTKGETK